MTIKDFNLAYRQAVSLMLRRLRSQALSEFPRFVDAMPGEVLSDSDGCPVDCCGDCEFCVKG